MSEDLEHHQHGDSQGEYEEEHSHHHVPIIVGKEIEAIFVGGVPSEIDEKFLTEQFSQFGEVKSAKIINSIKTKKPKRFAIIAFSEPIPASILTQDHYIHSRKVDVKEYLSGEEANNKLNKEKTRKVFVGGLPLSVTNDMLKSYFQTFGKVIEANIVYNHETMKSRGFGFVIFQDEKTVQEVLKRYDDHYLFGKWIECKPALLKEEVTSNDPPQQQTHNPMSNHRGGYQGQQMGHQHSHGHGHSMPQAYGGGHAMHHQMRGGMHGAGHAGNQRDGPMVGNMAHMPVPSVPRGRGGNPGPINHRGGASLAMPRPQNDDSGVESPETPKRGGYQGQAPKRGGGGGKVEPTSSHIHHNPQSKAAPPEDDDKEDSEGHDDTHQSGIHSSSGPSNNNYYDYNSQYSHGGHQAGYSYTNPSGGSYNYGMQGHPHPGSQNYGGMYNYGPGGMSRHPAKPNYPAYGGANYDYNSRQGYGQQTPMHMKTGNSHMVHNQYYQEHDYGEEAQVSPGARAPGDGPGYGNMKGADYNRNDRSQKAPGQGMQYPHQYGGHMSQQMYGGAGAGQHSGSEQSGSYDYTSAYKQPPSKPGPELGAPGGMGYNYRQPQMPIPSYNPGVNNDSDSGKPHGGPGASKIPGGAKQGSGSLAKK